MSHPMVGLDEKEKSVVPGGVLITSAISEASGMNAVGGLRYAALSVCSISGTWRSKETSWNYCHWLV